MLDDLNISPRDHRLSGAGVAATIRPSIKFKKLNFPISNPFNRAILKWMIAAMLSNVIYKTRLLPARANSRMHFMG